MMPNRPAYETRPENDGPYAVEEFPPFDPTNPLAPRVEVFRGTLNECQLFMRRRENIERAQLLVDLRP